MRQLSGRVLVAAGAAQLAGSYALVMWASLARDPLPAWPKVLDVALAFTIVFTAAMLWARAERVPAGERLREFRVSVLAASTLPSVVLLAAWLLRDRLDWGILLPGLAWRLFITSYALPAALTEAGRSTGARPRHRR